MSCIEVDEFGDGSSLKYIKCENEEWSLDVGNGDIDYVMSNGFELQFHHNGVVSSFVMPSTTKDIGSVHFSRYGASRQFLSAMEQQGMDICIVEGLKFK